MLRNLLLNQRWLWIMIVVLFLVAGALVLLLDLLGDPQAGRMTYFLIGVGILAVLALALMATVARMQARSMLDSSMELSGDLRYQFRSDGFHYESDFSSADVRWETLHSAVERRDAFVLFPSKAHFTLIPKRAFADAAAVGAFRQLLREALGATLS